MKVLSYALKKRLSIHPESFVRLYSLKWTQIAYRLVDTTCYMLCDPGATLWRHIQEPYNLLNSSMITLSCEILAYFLDVRRLTIRTVSAFPAYILAVRFCLRPLFSTGMYSLVVSWNCLLSNVSSKFLHPWWKVVKYVLYQIEAYDLVKEANYVLKVKDHLTYCVKSLRATLWWSFKVTSCFIRWSLQSGHPPPYMLDWEIVVQLHQWMPHSRRKLQTQVSLHLPQSELHTEPLEVPAQPTEQRQPISDSFQL